jgi:Gamma-glutamyl phosphate reductase
MNIAEMMNEIGQNARLAARTLSQSDSTAKSEALIAVAKKLSSKQKLIISENQNDLFLARKKKLSTAMIDRLMLDEGRLEQICNSLREIANYPDPIGKILSKNVRPNGLKISKVCTNSRKE